MRAAKLMGFTPPHPSPTARSYVGENKEFERQVWPANWSCTPQGTLAERCAPAAPAFPAFYTKTGVGTLVAEGKETREFDGEEYVMERGLFADVSPRQGLEGRPRATSSTARPRATSIR
jgi:hypothetical protein